MTKFLLGVAVTILLFYAYWQVTELDDLGELVETVEFSFKPDGKFWGESLFKRQYGDVLCQAQTLTSVQTRVVTNFLDLEVYCRDLASDFSPEIITLPKPSTSLIGAYIQNYKGQLYSKTSGEIFNFTNGRWDSAPHDLRRLYYLQPYKNEWVKIQHGKNGCKTLSFKIPTYETLCIDTTSESAILVWDSKIYVNDDGDLNIYELPKNNELLTSLSPKEIIEGKDRSYFIVPIEDQVVWGGSGEYIEGCAPVNLLKGELKLINYVDCDLQRITEYYSIIQTDEGFLIGTYPSGNIVTFGEENNLQTVHKVHDVEKRRYFESQSLTQSQGLIFIGLYPYGEVIVWDTSSGDPQSRNILRFFSEPPKSVQYKTPYFGEFLDEAGHYKEGINPNLLGQRIPTSALLDGKLCFSTGNFSFYRPSVEVASKISNLDEYGKVHCMMLPNQTLLSTQNENTFRVDLYKRGFRVYSAGNLISSVKFKNLTL